MEWLLNRYTIVGLAIIGGLCSVLASWIHSRVSVSEKSIRHLNRAAYLFMGASIMLFIFAGLLGVEK